MIIAKYTNSKHENYAILSKIDTSDTLENVDGTRSTFWLKVASLHCYSLANAIF